MPTSSFNLRNITPHVLLTLKKEAAKQKTSVNSLILKFIEQNLGIVCAKKQLIFHDLDYLAGTWSDKDKKEFEDNTKLFEGIDEDLWS